MMKKLLVFFILFLPAALRAQAPANAYYLAKRLVSLEQQIKTDTTNAHDEEIRKMISYVMAYAELDSFDYENIRDKLSDYPILKSLVGEMILKADYRSFIFSYGTDKLEKLASGRRINAEPLIKAKKELDRLRKAMSISSIDSLLTTKESAIPPEIMSDTSLMDSGKMDREKWKIFYESLLKTDRESIISTLNNKVDNQTVWEKWMKIPDSIPLPLMFEDTDSAKVDTSWLRLNTGKWKAEIRKTLSPLIDSVKNKKLESAANEVLTKFNDLSTEDQESLVAEVYKGVKSVSAALGGFRSGNQGGLANVNAIPLMAQSVPAATGSIGFKLPTETEMINAMAIYLASRVKQEAVLWFFEQIRKNAQNEELLRMVFPETIRMLMSEASYDVPNMGTAWRYALSKDFVTMPGHIVESGWFQNKLGPDRLYIQDYLRISLKIAGYISAKFSYRDMIRQMYLYGLSQTSVNRESAYAFGLINTLYAFSSELNRVDTSSTEGVRTRSLSYEELTALSTREMGAMVSLLDLKYGRPLLLLYPGCFTDFDRAKAGKLAAWAGQVLINLNQFDNVLSEMKARENQNKDDKTEFNYYNIYSLLSSLLTQLAPDFDGQDAAFKTRVVKGIYFVNTMNEVHHLLSEKNYAGAVGQTLSLLNEALYDLQVENQPVDAAFTATKSKANTDDVLLKDNSTFARIRKFSAFLNDVAEAQGDEQLAKVVRSYALPAGSYKRKRNAWFSADFNAYVGVFGGAEKSVAPGSKLNLSGLKGVYGISAPMGFSLSWGYQHAVAPEEIKKDQSMYNPGSFRRTTKGYKHLSGNAQTLFFSLVDLGTVLTFRMTGESEVDHDFYWKQLFSPGVHYNFGIKNTPLVVDFGFQYTPELRRITSEGLEKGPFMNTLRLQAGVFFDLPLFNIHSTTQ